MTVLYRECLGSVPARLFQSNTHGFWGSTKAVGNVSKRLLFSVTLLNMVYGFGMGVGNVIYIF